MRLTFDPQVFVTQRYGGISRYFASLLNEFAAYDDCEIELFLPLHFNVYAAQDRTGRVSGLHLPRIPKSGRVVKFLSGEIWRLWVARYAPDVIHETYYAAKPYGNSAIPRVITVYDMIHELYPKYFKDAERVSQAKRQSIARAQHVICISEQTRTDLLNIFDVNPDKTSIIHLGFDDLSRFISEDVSTPSSAPERPYFLFVGGRGAYKNFSGFIEAFAKSRLASDDFGIKCFGGGGFTRAEFDLFRDLRLDCGKINQIDGEDCELARAYRDAVALVYPSLYEGFGLPPLEAMSVGCPVVCSDTPAVLEVVGNAAEVFDRTSSSALTAALEELAYSSSRRAALAHLGGPRSREFSWSNCARATIEKYTTLR